MYLNEGTDSRANYIKQQHIKIIVYAKRCPILRKDSRKLHEHFLTDTWLLRNIPPDAASVTLAAPHIKWYAGRRDFYCYFTLLPERGYKLLKV